MMRGIINSIPTEATFCPVSVILRDLLSIYQLNKQALKRMKNRIDSVVHSFLALGRGREVRMAAGTRGT